MHLKNVAKKTCATLVACSLPSVSSAINSPYHHQEHRRFITSTFMPSLVKPVTRIHNNHFHYAPVQPIRQIRPTPLARMLAAPIATHRSADAPNAGLAPMVASTNPTASSLVSRILQMALGLFVTTMELPPLSTETSDRVGFDCDFSTSCRWSSIGLTSERWRLARGEPDVLLWLAATGTMVLPAEPFTLIEVRGGSPTDMLCSDVIGCQREPSLFSFTYWTVGTSDLEICLLDLKYRQFNCTGMLQSHIQPGKVALKVPAVKYPFRIAIIPSSDAGIVILDNIHYEPKYCGDPPPLVQPLPIISIETTTLFTNFVTTTAKSPDFLGLTGPTSIPFLPTSEPRWRPDPVWTPPTASPTLLPNPFTPIVAPFTTPLPPLLPIVITMPTFAPLPNEFGPFGISSTSFPRTAPTLPTQYPFVTPKPIVIVPEPLAPFITTTAPPSTLAPTPQNGVDTNARSKEPFDLLIMGNRTTPFFDRRRGSMIQESNDLICDFANNFPCLWGPDNGKWAIIEKGAIPWLDNHIGHRTHVPTYPAGIVIQSVAALTSDPIRCQTGEGQLLFRYWTNARVLIQVCAIGRNVDSSKIQCVEEVAKSVDTTPVMAIEENGDETLAVFKLTNSIREPFTLSITPIWDKNSRNSFMVIDEIAYIGECNLTAVNTETLLQQQQRLSASGAGPMQSISRFSMSGPNSNSNSIESSSALVGEKTSHKSKSKNKSGEESGSAGSIESAEEKLSMSTVNLNLLGELTTKKSTKMTTTTPSTTIMRFITTTDGTWNTESWTPLDKTQSRRSSLKGTRYPFLPTMFTTTRSITDIDLLSGLGSTIIYPFAGVTPRHTATTEKSSFTIPYTPQRRNTSTTEAPPIDYCKILNCDFNASSNAQFVSTVLGPGDFAILESPRFNMTQGINVLLFQYYRPTHSATIRLCMGTRHSKPFRTVASFLQCPPILRSLTSKNAFKWNSVHIQLPPGTSHFYLVAHNLDRSAEKAAIGIDNIRVAICDPRSQTDANDVNETLKDSNESADEQNNDVSDISTGKNDNLPPNYQDEN